MGAASDRGLLLAGRSVVDHGEAENDAHPHTCRPELLSTTTPLWGFVALMTGRQGFDVQLRLKVQVVSSEFMTYIPRDTILVSV